MASTGTNVNPNTSTEDAQEEQVNMNKLQQLEEEALKLKYPGTTENTTALLHKSLQKGQKFFDSGDYQMAKQKCERRITFSMNSFLLSSDSLLHHRSGHFNLIIIRTTEGNLFLWSRTMYI
uniref:Uncharacterized protein n=1 Tax=Glossina austeni TaxID=7395 RepID=A0A1A9UN32_GLOAU